MTYFIAIPSYKRAKICNEKTLTTLFKLGLPREKINVFVTEDDYEEYKNILNPEYYNDLIVGEVGIVNQREFIEEFYNEGTHLLMIDDDITELDLSLSKYKTADEFITDAFNECVKQNAFIWGIYPVYNPFFRNSKTELTTNLTYIIACFYGTIIRRCPELQLDLTREGNKEDVERSILYWLKDGKVLRFNKISVKTKYYGTDGGGLGTFKNRLEPMKVSTIKLNEKYPDLTKIKIRKNGLYEIVLNSKATPPVYIDITDSPKYLSPIDPSDDLVQEIMALLSNITVPMNSNKTGRAMSFGRHRAMTLGFIRSRVTRKYGLSLKSKKYPELYNAILALGKKIVPFDFTSIHVNHNVVCPRHLDPKNVGNSVIVSLGDYQGCDLVIENHGTYNMNCKPLLFDGSKNYHYNTPLISGNKYSFVFFNQPEFKHPKEV